MRPPTVTILAIGGLLVPTVAAMRQVHRFDAPHA